MDRQEPKLLIDACVTPALRPHLLHHRGIDVVCVGDVLPMNASDDQILALAQEQGRIIVTGNAVDFRTLAKNNPGHPGLVIFLKVRGKARQLALGERIVDRLLADIERARNPAGMVYEVDPDGRIKCYRLPTPK